MKQQWLEQAKELGSVVAALSASGYVLGYLTLRARAHLLGTNPAFKLVDEAYVFAGFRLVLVTLIILLLSSPLWVGSREAVPWLAARITPTQKTWLSWLFLLAMVALTVFNLRILACSSVLLEGDREPANALERAVRGGGGAVTWLFIATLLPLASGAWLLVRLRSGSGPFEWTLGAAVLIQLCLLPVYHGVLFTDRKVRVLAERPPGLDQLTLPLGVVDQTSELATLYGLDKAGARTLTAVPLADLNKLRIHRVVPLHTFMSELSTNAASLHAAVKLDVSSVVLTDGTHSAERKPPVSNAAAKQTVNQSFLDQVIEFLRGTFEAIGSLGESPVTEGELWEASIDAAGRVVDRKRIGHAGDLSWPVRAAGDRVTWALRANRLVALQADGSVAARAPEVRWRKLVGVTPQHDILGFMFDEAKVVPAIFTHSGTLQRGSREDSPENHAKLARLLGESRAYADKVALTVERSERGGRGFDVWLQRGDRRTNISDCADDSCGQPSLVDLQHVLYVRSSRY